MFRKFNETLEYVAWNARADFAKDAYVIFTEYEAISLMVCIMLDISEYIVAILLMPLVGDILDVVGIVACLFMFHWVGIISLFELVPGADILPIFIITWLIWYFLKKQREKEKQEKLRKKWL